MTAREALEVVNGVGDDPGAPWERSVLEAAAVLWREDKPKYQRFRAQLKKSGLTQLRQWETEVRKGAQESVREGGAVAFRSGSDAELGRLLISELTRERAKPVFTEGAFWAYEPTGRWARWSPGQLRTRIASWDGSPIMGANTLKVSQNKARGAVSLACDMSEDRDFFRNNRRGVAFRDLFVYADPEKGEILTRSHGPDNRARLGFEWDYAADHGLSELNDYLLSVFDGAEDRHERIELLSQFFGAVLFCLAPTMGCALVLLGDRGSGKSTCVKLAEALLPPHFRCSLNPSELDDKFNRGQLAGKHLNASYELPAKELLKESWFKKIVHGETTNAQHKHRDPFEFTPLAAHLFAANGLPPAPGVTPAYWDRWMVLRFPNTFRGADGERKSLAEAIVSQELPGLIAWAVSGAALLLKQGAYTIPSSSAEALATWKRAGNSVATFIHECTVPIGDPVAGSSWPRVTDIHRAYTDYCKEVGFSKPVALVNFSKYARSAGVDVCRANGTRLRVKLRQGWRMAV